MPRQEQIIPQYLHPHVETYINDNTTYTTETAVVDTNVKSLHVFTSNRGIDNKVLRFDSFSDWKRMYGTPDYKWDGQAVMMPYASLSSGHAATFNMRVMPEDATHAFSVITVAPSSDLGVLKLDWAYETVNVKLTSFDRDTIKTLILSSYKGDRQPVFAFICKGRGEYGNSIYAEFIENTRSSKTNGFLTVDVRTAEIDTFGEDYNGQICTGVSPYEEAISTTKLTSFIEDIMDDNNIDVDAVVFEDTLEALYEQYMSLDSHDDVEYLRFDFLFGRFYGENQEYKSSLKSFSSNFRELTNKNEKLFANGSDGKISKYIKVDKEKIKNVVWTPEGAHEVTYSDNATELSLGYKITEAPGKDVDPDKVIIKGGKNKYIYTEPTEDGIVAKVYMIPTLEEVTQASNSLVSELKVGLRSIYSNETVETVESTIRVTFTDSGTYPVIESDLTHKTLTYAGIGNPCEEAIELPFEATGSAIENMYNIYYTNDQRVLIDPLTGQVTPLQEVVDGKPLAIQVFVKHVVNDPLGSDEPIQYGTDKEFTVNIQATSSQVRAITGQCITGQVKCNENVNVENVLSHNYNVTTLLKQVRVLSDETEELVHEYVTKKSGSSSSIRIPNKDRQDNIDELFVQAFSGSLDKKIKSSRSVPVDYILDANYADLVKMTINTLVQKRQDCMGYLDAGIAIETPQELIEYYEGGMTSGIRERNIVREGQHYTIRDPFTKKRITVTTTYFLAQQLPNHIYNSGRHVPFVGQTEANVTGIIRNSFLPAIDGEDADAKESLYNLGVNIYEVVDANNYVRATQSTSQSISSDLSEENNMLTLLQIKRELELMVSSLTYNFAEAEDRKRFSESADRLLSKYRGTGIRSGSVSFDVSPYEEERNIIHCYLSLVFRSMSKTGIIEIDINPRTSKS